MCSSQQAKHAAEAAKEFPARGPPILGRGMHGWSSRQLAQTEAPGLSVLWAHGLDSILLAVPH